MNVENNFEPSKTIIMHQATVNPVSCDNLNEHLKNLSQNIPAVKKKKNSLGGHGWSSYTVRQFLNALKTKLSGRGLK